MSPYYPNYVTNENRFLLAKLHMDALATMHTPKKIRKALTDLPRGENALTKSYDRGNGKN
jgi:hypothetical protein